MFCCRPKLKNESEHNSKENSKIVLSTITHELAHALGIIQKKIARQAVEHEQQQPQYEILVGIIQKKIARYECPVLLGVSEP